MINGPCEGPWLYAVLLLSLPVTLRSMTWILNFCIKFLCFKFLMNVKMDLVDTWGDVRYCPKFVHCITKTYLYNFDPLKPHFYIVKLEFTGVYSSFLIPAQKIDCGYSLEPPQ